MTKQTKTNNNLTRTGGMASSAVDAIVMWLLRVYWRANAVIGYFVLLLLDYFIFKTTNEKWDSIRSDSLSAIKRCWYKY